MALRNTPSASAPAAAAATPPGAFEAEEGDTTVQAAAPTPAAAPEPAAAPAATPVAEAPKRAVVKLDPSAQKFADEVSAMKGAADFSWGNYKVFKANQGKIGANETKEKLGRWIKVTMFGWNEHWEASPNSKSEKSKDYLAFSDDGATVHRVVSDKVAAQWVGKPLDAYVKYLQVEADYPESKSRRFIDIGCLLIESDSGEMAGEIIQITLSQSSIPSFSRYQETLVQKAKLAARGIASVKVPEDPFTFYLVCEDAQKGDNEWTKLAVLDKLPAALQPK